MVSVAVSKAVDLGSIPSGTASSRNGITIRKIGVLPLFFC